ncbi:copper chaperone PCu(A)C [Corynebacterium sp. YIM 101645]|uniref:Copper chaperone PCu(A)C n=1 Tax=Corynebacterium lemuris TaxID=1859292 RepID=A0ABT2FVU9_9CORY|nr:copper chaperone PCu(A)C [Corynebacterium lemuris]MCS5479094.1 copper chaperone PCu(A)C [Corynebacterium lemuris]
MMFNRGRIAVSVLVVSALTLAGCATGDNGADTTTTATATSAAAQAATDVTFTEGVVRAMEADKGMTGIFGTFINHTDEEINVTGFSADFEDASFELHEVTDGVMQEKPGGFVIPAGESHELVPGGDHMMIMDYMGEIPAGDVVDITVELADGSTFDIKEIPVRTMNPGDEDYGSDGSLMGHDH